MRTVTPIRFGVAGPTETVVQRRQNGERLTATCVVVAYHRPEALEALLGLLDHPALDVVVVNVEDDPLVTRAAAGTRVVPLTENGGYAVAVNAGVRAATGDFVVFLNDDVRIDAAAILRLVDVIASGCADVAVPRVLDRRGRLERTVASLPTPAALAREWLLLPDRPVPLVARAGVVQKWRVPAAGEVIDAASAVVVAARRELLVDQPLPEHYFMYWEESEWFWQLHERRAVVRYVADATVIHDGGRGDVRADKSQLLARNAVRCVFHTQGRRAARAAYGIVVLWNARLALVDGCRRVLRPRSTSRARVQARVAGLGAALSSWREVR